MNLAYPVSSKSENRIVCGRLSKSHKIKYHMMKSQQKKLYEKKQYTNNTTNLKEVVVKGNVDNKLNQDLVLFAQFLLIARLISFHIFIFLHIGIQSLFTSYFISATHCTSTEKKMPQIIVFFGKRRWFTFCRV